MIYFVDRSLAVIKPKQPFIDWLKAIPNTDLIDIQIDNLRVDCNSFLLPECQEPEEAVAYIDTIFDSLFEMELAAWEDDTSLWPSDRSLLTFWTWFDVEIHSTVFDSVDADIRNIPAQP